MKKSTSVLGVDNLFIGYKRQIFNIFIVYTLHFYLLRVSGDSSGSFLSWIWDYEPSLSCACAFLLTVLTDCRWLRDDVRPLWGRRSAGGGGGATISPPSWARIISVIQYLHIVFWLFPWILSLFGELFLWILSIFTNLFLWIISFYVTLHPKTGQYYVL